MIQKNIEKEKRKENSWLYNGLPIDEENCPPSWACGFCYMIVNLETGGMYIGKKSLTSIRKKKIGVRAQAKQKAETGDGRVKKVERIVKSSGWESYNSSNKTLAAEITVNPEKFRKTIIEWAYSKKNLSWLEVKYIVKTGLMERESNSYNENLMGKFWKHDTSRELYEQYKQKLAEKKAGKTHKTTTDDTN